MMKSLHVFACILIVIVGAFLSACQAVSATPTSTPTETLLPTETSTSTPIPPPTLTPTMMATRTPKTGFETVSFQTEDGVKLSGKLYGNGDVAVILAHQGYHDQDSWRAFANNLARNGYTALTFDFRGNGKSGGTLGAQYLEKDVRAAYHFLMNGDIPYTKVLCVGASFGGTACMVAALTVDFDGLIIIGSRMSEGAPTLMTPQDFPKLTMPKLFICTKDDHDGKLAPVAQQMFDYSEDPKEIKILPGSAHGTDIFDTSQETTLKNTLLAFITQFE